MTLSGHKIAAMLLAMAGAGLSGCGAANVALRETTADPAGMAAIPGVAISGTAYGGQQPIAASRVQLYAVGSTGYGSAYTYATGTDLLGNNVVMTDANGKFSLPAYTCPSATTNVYLVLTGGTPASGQPANTNLALMLAFGPCNSAAANAGVKVAVDELTTVAAVYALAPFMSAPPNVGSSVNNLAGLNHAFATAANLVSINTGDSPGPSLPAGTTIPVAELNTLADMLASCVNSYPATAGGVSSSCSSLFALTPNSSSVAPGDTITAMLNIAKNPSQNASLLNGRATPQSPFQPTLGIAPTAWTVAITYAPAGLSAPVGIAQDPYGAVWVANTGASSAMLLSAGGALTGTYGAGSTGRAIAVDYNGNAWATANGTAQLLEFAYSSGTLSTYSGGGLSTASNALAIDGTGQIWITGSQNGVSVFSKTGTPVTSTPYTGESASNPASIAITSH